MNDKRFNVFLDYAAAVMLALCVLGVFVMACMCFPSNEPMTHRIVLTVSPDSVYDEEKFSYYTDSLISVINKHEHVIADRYEAILEDKADVQKYWSVAGILVSAILGVAGFFGFRSIKDIEYECEEKAKKIAESTAECVSTKVSKEKTKAYLQSHLKKEVLEASDVYFGNQENHISKMINDEMIRVTNDFENKINDLTEHLGDIEERFDRMEASLLRSDSPEPETPKKEANPSVESTVTSESDSHPKPESASGEIDLFE